MVMEMAKEIEMEMVKEMVMEMVKEMVMEMVKEMVMEMAGGLGDRDGFMNSTCAKVPGFVFRWTRKQILLDMGRIHMDLLCQGPSRL